MKTDINKNDLRELIVYSFRYALGRSTYVCSFMSDMIKQHHELITEFDKSQIITDIHRALESGTAGMNCDATTWLKLKEWLQK